MKKLAYGWFGGAFGPRRCGFILVLCLFCATAPGAKESRHADLEDSLQRLVQQNPDNPSHWLDLAQFELKTDQDDLAKGYFDEAIRLSKNSADVIVRIGLMWLNAGKVESSLPYLFPNLGRVDSETFAELEKDLEAEKHFQAAEAALRLYSAHRKGFTPEVRRAAELAYNLGRYPDCRDILAPYAGDLDTAAAHWLLLSAFYLGKSLHTDAVQNAARRCQAPSVKVLAALDLSLLGEFSAAQAWLEAAGAAATAPEQSFVAAEEAAAHDRVEQADREFQNALASTWPQFRLVATAELYKHYSVTGNGFKANQLWGDIKEQDTSLAQKEFLANQLNLRGYEKQAHELYRGLYRDYPGRPAVLLALWDELVDDDTSGLGAQIAAVIAADPMSCDAGLLAMRYAKLRNDDREIVHYGRNVALYCFDVVEPYFDLAMSLLKLSKPDEARIYFAKYVKSGGDKTRVPTYMR